MNAVALERAGQRPGSRDQIHGGSRLVPVQPRGGWGELGIDPGCAEAGIAKHRKRSCAALDQEMAGTGATQKNKDGANSLLARELGGTSDDE